MAYNWGRINTLFKAIRRTYEDAMTDVDFASADAHEAEMAKPEIRNRMNIIRNLLDEIDAEFDKKGEGDRAERLTISGT